MWDISRGVGPHSYIDRTLWRLSMAMPQPEGKNGNKRYYSSAKKLFLDNEPCNSSFPLVVCAAPFVSEFLRKPRKLPNVRIVERLSRLTKHLDNAQKLKAQILRIAGDYGMLSLAPKRNSLQDWTNEAKRALLYLNLADLVRGELKKPDYEQATVAEMLEAARPPAHLRSDSIYQAEEDDRQFLSIVMQFTQDDTLLGRMFSASAVGTYRESIKLLHPLHRSKKIPQGQTEVALFRTRLRDFFWLQFKKQAIFSLREDTFIFRQGCNVQMSYELSEAFSGNTELRSCKHCGRIFFPRDGKQKFCDLPGKSGCRVAYHRR